MAPWDSPAETRPMIVVISDPWIDYPTYYQWMIACSDEDQGFGSMPIPASPYCTSMAEETELIRGLRERTHRWTGPHLPHTRSQRHAGLRGGKRPKYNGAQSSRIARGRHRADCTRRGVDSGR